MENIKINTFFVETIKKIAKKYPGRLLDILNCFSENQHKNKMWLIEKLNDYLPDNFSNRFIDIGILGSWYGYLIYLLKEHSKIKFFGKVRLFDIDDGAKKFGSMFFTKEHFGNIKFKTKDVKDVDFSKEIFNIIINTSCEHIPNETIHTYLNTVRPGVICVLQSNDYTELDEHINCSKSEKEFLDEYSGYFNNIKSYTLNMDKYNRFMIIGTKK